MSLRIRGLVKALNWARQSLQAGFLESEKVAFRSRVEEFIEEVDDLCEMHHTTPDTLPAPSRKAYYFLKAIDLDNLPDRVERSSSEEEEQNTPRPQTIRIKNVVKMGTDIHKRLWEAPYLFNPGSDGWKHLRVELELTTRRIEELCANKGGSPSLLVEPSRRVYAWMCFLRSAQNLQQHVEALKQIRRLSRRIAPIKAETLEVQLNYSNVLWRVRHKEGTRHLTVHSGFAPANEEVWEALLRGALQKQTKDRRQRVDEYAASESFAGVEFELESFVTSLERQTQGQHHNLHDCFQRMNERYFQRRMDAPELRWNARPTTSKMGHYQPGTDTIMLSISLDHPDVPEFVIDFVMYHEMLHKKHGIQLVNGRRMAHTPAFRREEQQYERYEEAERFLQRWAHQ